MLQNAIVVNSHVILNMMKLAPDATTGLRIVAVRDPEPKQRRDTKYG